MDDPRFRTLGPGDLPEDASPPTIDGIRDQLGQIGSSLASALDTRLRIAALDLAEERERARDRFTWMLIVAIAATFSVLALNALGVMLLWPILGWRSLALSAFIWLVIAGIAIWRSSILARCATPPFASTIAEFERDRRWIAERFGRRSA